MIIVKLPHITFLFSVQNWFSVAVPSFRRHIPVPSVYSKEEVEQLLSSVDRNTEVGRRNYAILVLIARLGLRSSDIVNLRFKNLNFTANVIGITQVKTGELLTLPLTAGIRNATLDYTVHRRPDHNSDYVFLSSDAPIRPLGDRAIYLIVSRAFTTAGVQINGRKHGPHALRSSLATALLDEGYSYPVITKVLGHNDPNTAQHYVKVDIIHLRECAMQVPPPSGMFYKYLLGEEEVMWEKNTLTSIAYLHLRYDLLLNYARLKVISYAMKYIYWKHWTFFSWNMDYAKEVFQQKL